MTFVTLHRASSILALALGVSCAASESSERESPAAVEDALPGPWLVDLPDVGEVQLPAVDADIAIIVGHGHLSVAARPEVTAPWPQAERVAELAGFEVPTGILSVGGWFIEPLYRRLAFLTARAARKTPRPRAVFLVHADAPFRLLGRVAYTAGQAELGPAFVVKTARGPGVLPIAVPSVCSAADQDASALCGTATVYVDESSVLVRTVAEPASAGCLPILAAGTKPPSPPGWHNKLHYEHSAPRGKPLDTAAIRRATRDAIASGGTRVCDHAFLALAESVPWRRAARIASTLHLPSATRLYLKGHDLAATLKPRAKVKLSPQLHQAVEQALPDADVLGGVADDEE